MRILGVDPGYAIVGFGVKLARFSKQCCSYRQQKSRDFQARQRDVEDAVPYRLFGGLEHPFSWVIWQGFGVVG